MTSVTDPPRVVVADDSALMRRIVTNLLQRGGVEVVGSARDGDEALALCEREQPDAMTLDLAMPEMSGIEVLRALREGRTAELPVVVVSAFSPAAGARAVDALAEGAFELVSKPAIGEDLAAFEQGLLDKVLAAVQARRRLRPAGATRRHAADAARGPAAPAASRGATNGGAGTPRTHTRRGLSRVLLIATSTGGPRALSTLLPRLPSPMGLGTLIVQHMPAGFTSSLAARLDRTSALTVTEAQGAEALSPAHALLAPGGRHLRLSPAGRTQVSDEPAVGGLRPRADLLIEDAARVYGERLVLAVLTGMGSDGLAGAREVRRRGGVVLAESPETCTVYGMPRSVTEAGLAHYVLPLERLADAIVAEAR